MVCRGLVILDELDDLDDFGLVLLLNLTVYHLFSGLSWFSQITRCFNCSKELCDRDIDSNKMVKQHISCGDSLPRLGDKDVLLDS